MASSLARYLRFYKNRTDLILILVTAIVVYLPNSVVQNPSGWSLRVHEQSPPSPGKILPCEERKIVEKPAPTRALGLWDPGCRKNSVQKY